MVATLGKFGLTLEPTKTKLVEFGRFAYRHAAKRGRRRPETIYFLGFTLYCTRNLKGNFQVGMRTEKSRLRRSLMSLHELMRRIGVTIIGGVMLTSGDDGWNGVFIEAVEDEDSRGDLYLTNDGEAIPVPLVSLDLFGDDTTEIAIESDARWRMVLDCLARLRGGSVLHGWRFGGTPPSPPWLFS